MHMQHRIRWKWLWLFKYCPNNNRTLTTVNRCHWTTFYKQSFVRWLHWLINILQEGYDKFNFSHYNTAHINVDVSRCFYAMDLLSMSVFSTRILVFSHYRSAFPVSFVCKAVWFGRPSFENTRNIRLRMYETWKHFTADILWLQLWSI